MTDNKPSSAEHHIRLMGRITETRDKEAFRELFDHYAPRVKSYLLRFKMNAELAEDLAQEVMITVWRKADLYDPGKAALSTWIFRIARNRFIDQTRKQKYPEVDAETHMANMAAPEQTDQPVITRQIGRNVQIAMAALGNDQRQVIELSFFEELSHAQIADRLSLPLGTVKSRIRLAFKVLRNELEHTS